MGELVHVVCPRCSTVNRVPVGRIGAKPVCGKCSSSLFPGRPVELNAAGLDVRLERGELPLVVDFWAPWCGPCKMMAPAFERAAAELEPRVVLAKVDTQAEPDLGARFGVRSIPTLIAFRDGREVGRQSGAMDVAGIRAWVRSVLGV